MGEVAEVDVEGAVVAEYKNQMNCPLCKEELYSGIGKGCKLCGMPLPKEKKEFCSKKCKTKYRKIHIKIQGSKK